MRRSIVLVFALSVLAATFGFSQGSGGEKYAFLVVCSKYNSTDLRDLPYTIEEMEDFRKALLKTGFEADHIIFLHDKADRERVPEKQKIEKQFRLLLNGLQPSDTVVVVLNGHGVHYKEDKTGYYCPLGTDLKDKKTLVSMEFFYSLLKKSKARQKLMIVQACQNDPFVSNDFAAQRFELTEKSDEVPEGIAAIFSCMEGQKSYYDPDRKRGLFFDHVIRSWSGEYLHANEKKLDLETFFRQVRVKTKADALKFKGGVEQVPEVRREYKGEWVVAIPIRSGALDPVDDQLDVFVSSVGLKIRKDARTDQIRVTTPIYMSPAYKAGLRTDDIITTITSEVDPKTGKPYEKPEVISTKGMSTADAVKKILGKEGTRVKLLIEREGSPKPLEFIFIRGNVEVESVMGFKRNKDHSWNYVIEPENKICYVRLGHFTENTYRDLEKVMKDLHKQGIKGFILDLRFNPGGSLVSSIKISDLFIDDGMIVTIRNRDSTETSYVGRSDGSYTTFPMVCLINGETVGASEIVSACLQDHGRADIAGSRSSGKMQGWRDDEKLKDTTIWRPSGRNLNKTRTKGRDEDEWGVHPNVGHQHDLSARELKELQNHLRGLEIIQRFDKSDEAKTHFRDLQLESALEHLRWKIKKTK